MKVVIVESPAKAKTINKYLGSDFKVIASIGHVRDLSAKTGSVDVDHDFAMVWEIDKKAEKTLKEIAALVEKADELILATDPDREGEAISWHVLQIMQMRKVLNPHIPVKRVVFHEITKSAIQEALNHPRDLDQCLIDAYLARRALDYLVGFTLSPVLWRKLPGSKSAGRVQSVALRLITEREIEIENFKTQEYWTVEADVFGALHKDFRVKLTHLKGEKLDKFTLNREELAHQAVETIKQGQFSVADIEKKEVKRHPAPPFTTSTLQQEAARKLGFSTTRTMKTAQQLYEGIDLGQGERTGLITYMRTDSVHLSTEAVASMRDFIEQQFGASYKPEKPRLYKSKAKNAQEAHEAIRPTESNRHPDEVKAYLDADQYNLYQLIWKRTVASQMETALFDQMTIDIEDAKHRATLRATGSTLKFDGFLKLYQEGRDDESEQDSLDGETRLPIVEQNESISVKEVFPQQHFTTPPPRYTEASMVKKMEELGIGRPSTYSSILKTLQDRDYVVLDKKRFFPKDRGRIVVAFLVNFFTQYVEYDFTAHMEEQLDTVAHGQLDWKALLTQFWNHFNSAIEQTKDLTITDVIEKLDKDLDLMLFPKVNEDDNPRQCPQCADGRLGLKLGRFGAFIGCTNYPTCGHTRKLSPLSEEKVEAEEGESASPIAEIFETKVLGVDPKTQETIALRKGPYGFYFQWGEAVKGSKQKPKRVALPKGKKPEDASLEMALNLTALPKTLGNHPETGEEISVGVGRYGPYIKYQNKYTSVKGEDILALSLDQAIEILAQAKK